MYKLLLVNLSRSQSSGFGKFAGANVLADHQIASILADGGLECPAKLADSISGRVAAQVLQCAGDDKAFAMQRTTSMGFEVRLNAQFLKLLQQPLVIRI